MPRARIYKTNAERQAAYRDRQKAGLVVPKAAHQSATAEVARRVMAADAKAR